MARKYFPVALWTTIVLALYFLLRALFQPHLSGISLTPQIVMARAQEIALFVLAIAAGIGMVELYLYQIFFRAPRSRLTNALVRLIQAIFALFAFQLIVLFFDLTDLFRLPEGALKAFFSMPLTLSSWLRERLLQSNLVSQENASLVSNLLLSGIGIALFILIHQMTQPRTSRLGFAYLLVAPAFIGVLFLIVYPFLFEIKLAFSNASLGTQATKNASTA